MDNNTFIVQAGHVVTFDVEDAVACDGSVSGWTTGLAGITITGAAVTPGELRLSTANNSNPATRVYCIRLKAGAKIVGTSAAVFGRLLSGTSLADETPMPTGAVHVIYDAGATATAGFVDTRYLDVRLYCAAPTATVYTLTAAAGTADTALTVTPDPATEVEWRAGWALGVNDVAQGVESTNATLHGTTPVAANTINLSGAIGTAKNIGARVCLLQRNVEVRWGHAGYAFAPVSGDGGSMILDCAIRQTNVTLQGRGVNGGVGTIMQGSAVISGCTYGIYAGTGHTMQGSAVISGCSNGIYAGTGHTMQGLATIQACTQGINQGLLFLRGVTLGGAGGLANTRDVLYPSDVRSYGATLASASQVTSYPTQLCAEGDMSIVLWDNAGVAKQYPKHWSPGAYGDTVTLASDPGSAPTGITEGCKFTLGQAGVPPAVQKPGFLDFPMWFPVGVLVSVTSYIYSSLQPSTMGEGPRLQILDPDATGGLYGQTPLAQTTMQSVNDAATTWVTVPVSYTEPTRSRMLILRVRATNSAGNLWFAHKVLTHGAGLGSPDGLVQ